MSSRERTMDLQELLQLLGAKEVDIYLLKKRIVELEAEIAAKDKDVKDS